MLKHGVWARQIVVPGSTNYPNIIGAIYFISGRISLLVQFVNVVLIVFIVYYVYEIIIELGATKRSAQIGSVITALFILKKPPFLSR